MARSDLQARPIYRRTRDSIEAHLTIVFAALAVSRWIEHQTGWSIRSFVKTARRYRTIQIQAGPHTITAADTLPEGSLPDLGRAVPRRSWPGGGTFPDSCGPARVRFVQSRCRWHLAWWPHGFGIQAYQRAD